MPMITLTTIALGIFALATLVTAVVSAMLYYHWVRYGVGMVSTFFVMSIYAIGTALLLLSAYGLITQL